MFRSTTIVMELVLNPAKVIFTAQHTTHTPLCDMLPHHQITYNDVILPSVLI
jgi:hypothetical protein